MSAIGVKRTFSGAKRTLINRRAPNLIYEYTAKLRRDLFNPNNNGRALLAIFEIDFQSFLEFKSE
jgi:hypothetical protein